MNLKHLSWILASVMLAFFAKSLQATEQKDDKSKAKDGYFLEPHLSAGLLLRGYKTVDFEGTIGPRYCEYQGSTVACGVQYFSVGTINRYRYLALGLGYYGQGHGIPGGLFWEFGPLFEKSKTVGRQNTLTVSIPPIFFPVFFRWTDEGGDLPRYSIGLVLKYINFL